MRGSMKKAQTAAFNLPKITKQSKYTPLNKSVYLSKIKAEMPEQNDYSRHDDTKIEAEQTQLKSLLRDFNKEAYHILQDYIAHPKQQKNDHPSVQQIKKIKEYEGYNKKKIIDQCKFEIDKLEERCQFLKYSGLQQFQMQIEQTKKQIQAIKIENKDINRTVTVNGLNIVRGQQYDQIKNGEQQKVLLDLKKQNLQANNQSVLKEISQYNQKIPTSQLQINSLMEQYMRIIQIQEQECKDLAKKNQKQLKNQKIVNIKANLQQYQSFQRHKYLHKLKELQNFEQKCKTYDKKIEEISNTIIMRAQQQQKYALQLKKMTKR